MTAVGGVQHPQAQESGLGIEAFCPNGHRMKVKDHLAGRLGVCPTCGSRFRLPDISSAQTPRHPAPFGSIPVPSATAALPVAEPLPLDPTVISSLPIAVPYAGPRPPIDFPPPSATPPSAMPTAVTFGQGPLAPVLATVSSGLPAPGGTIPTGSGTPPPFMGTVPTAPPPDGPWSSPIDPPSDVSPVDPILEWAAHPRSRVVSRKRPRNNGGIGLSLTLVAIAAIAAAMAWMILRSRGIV